MPKGVYDRTKPRPVPAPSMVSPTLIFKVEFFIDDRRLGDVLRMLAGSGARDVTPVPVVNATKKSNGGLGAHLEGSSARAQFISWLKQNPSVKEINRETIREWCRAQGRPDGSAGMIKYLAEASIIKKAPHARGSKFVTWVVTRE